MAVTRTFSCNLCRDKTEINSLVGLHWQSWPEGWKEDSALTTENHICVKCLSSLQAMEKRCGQGYKCGGGPRCGSDHK